MALAVVVGGDGAVLQVAPSLAKTKVALGTRSRLQTAPTIEEGATALSKKAAELWDIGNRAEAQIEKMEREAVPLILVAGAAFHLAKAEVPHGEWEHLIKACSPIALRTVQFRMSAVDNALLKIGFTPETRAYETIVFSSKIAKAHTVCAFDTTTKYATHLIESISDALSGKSAKQIELELGIRKPKLITDGPHRTDEDVERSQRDQAARAVMNFCEGVTIIQNLGAHITEDQRLAVAWAARDALVRLAPQGWPIQIISPVHKQAIPIDEWLADQYGKRDVR